MFIKLSALAVLLPFVSALTITCPTEVEIGTTVTVTVSKTANDPSVADFYIVGPGEDFMMNSNVALGATVSLDVPCELSVGAGYVIIATSVGNANEPLAQTVPFITTDSEN